MTREQKLKEWKAQLKRLKLNPKRAAALLGVNSQTAYNWNCGQQTIPDKRIEQLQDIR